MSLSDRLARARGAHRSDEGGPAIGVPTEYVAPPSAGLDLVDAESDAMAPVLDPAGGAPVGLDAVDDAAQRAGEDGSGGASVHSSAWAALTNSAPDAPPNDALVELKERAAEELFRRIGTRLNDPNLSEERLHAIAREELGRIVETEQVALSAIERNRLIAEISADVLGFGPLEAMLDDPQITEIMVNRYDQIYVELGGRLARSRGRFANEAQLRRVIERIVSRVGRRVDESSPLVDARLEDGSRINAIIPPLAVDGSSLTVRKFSRTPYTAADLIRFGTLTHDMATLLEASVRARLNILVSGGTGTGKTTLLNVLSAFIPSDERIITIEDAVELQLQQEHVVRLEARPQNIEGRGEVSIRDLVRNSLRMRPDRIVVGEVRGGESLDMLQAMNTGHEGSISTIHANTPRDAIARLETLVLMAGMDLPLRAIREQIASAIDLIVQIARLRDGTRRIVSITEVQGMESDVVTLQEAFTFDYAAGMDAEGRFLGHGVPTGVVPRVVEKFADLNVAVPMSIFQTVPRDGLLAGGPR
ncbi:MAG TPA: CpaF family protein [Humibacter sp.]|nr:CpaF family protein [Humibacter sp.]